MTQGPAHPLDRAYVGDAHALLAAMREGDDAVVRQAYRRVFASPEGRLVLADQASRAGIGQMRPRGISGDERAELDGAANHALDILDLAGFDAASVAMMTMTETLEGHEDERSAQPAGSGLDWSDPAPELD